MKTAGPSSLCICLQDLSYLQVKQTQQSLAITGQVLVRRGRLVAALEYIQGKVDSHQGPTGNARKVFSPAWQGKQAASGTIRYAAALFYR